MKTYAVKDFTVLKDEKFTYCGKSYCAKRYLSKDKKWFVSSDSGFHYTMVYTATEEGKGVLEYDLYHQGNYSSYPIYTFESAIEKINKFQKETPYEFAVHESQFK